MGINKVTGKDQFFSLAQPHDLGQQFRSRGGDGEADIGLRKPEFCTFSTIIEEAPLPPVDGHPLEDSTWYFLERGSNGTNYAQVWCDTVRFEDGEIFYNDRDLSNKTECTTVDAKSWYLCCRR